MFLVEDNYKKMFEINGIAIMFDVLDTAGQEEFTAMRSGPDPKVFRDAHIVVFSLTSISSFIEQKT